MDCTKPLYEIQELTKLRAEQIIATHGDWPCRKGCADCCRHLGAEPRVSEVEWRQIQDAIEALPAEAAESVRQRIRRTAEAARPVTCPLLDSASGSCLIYEARPVVCRAYGFYAERYEVLGCKQVESISREDASIIWGNHAAFETRLEQLGSVMELSKWLESGIPA